MIFGSAFDFIHNDMHLKTKINKYLAMLFAHSHNPVYVIAANSRDHPKREISSVKNVMSVEARSFSTW